MARRRTVPAGGGGAVRRRTKVSTLTWPKPASGNRVSTHEATAAPSEKTEKKTATQYLGMVPGFAATAVECALLIGDFSRLLSKHLYPIPGGIRNNPNVGERFRKWYTIMRAARRVTDEDVEQDKDAVVHAIVTMAKHLRTKQGGFLGLNQAQATTFIERVEELQGASEVGKAPIYTTEWADYAKAVGILEDDAYNLWFELLFGVTAKDIKEDVASRSLTSAFSHGLTSHIMAGLKKGWGGHYNIKPGSDLHKWAMVRRAAPGVADMYTKLHVAIPSWLSVRGGEVVLAYGSTIVTDRRLARPSPALGHFPEVKKVLEGGSPGASLILDGILPAIDYIAYAGAVASLCTFWPIEELDEAVKKILAGVAAQVIVSWCAWLALYQCFICMLGEYMDVIFKHTTGPAQVIIELFALMVPHVIGYEIAQRIVTPFVGPNTAGLAYSTVAGTYWLYYKLGSFVIHNLFGYTLGAAVKNLSWLADEETGKKAIKAIGWTAPREEILTAYRHSFIKVGLIFTIGSIPHPAARPLAPLGPEATAYDQLNHVNTQLIQYEAAQSNFSNTLALVAKDVCYAGNVTTPGNELVCKDPLATTAVKTCFTLIRTFTYVNLEAARSVTSLVQNTLNLYDKWSKAREEFDKLKAWVQEQWDDLKAMFDASWNATKTTLNKTNKAIGKFFDIPDPLGAAVTLFQRAHNATHNSLENLYETIKNAFQKIADYAPLALSNLVKDFFKPFNNQQIRNDILKSQNQTMVTLADANAAKNNLKNALENASKYITGFTLDGLPEAPNYTKPEDELDSAPGTAVATTVRQAPGEL